MASEFVRRVRHVADINTFSKWGLEEGDLVLTNDNKMYALIGQEWKQLDNMEKVWATSEAGKYLMVGDDGIVKPMVIDDIRKGDNTWEGENKFSKAIEGTILYTELGNNQDLNELKKEGKYRGSNINWQNAPTTDKLQSVIEVMVQGEFILQKSYQFTVEEIHMYIRGFVLNKWQEWQQVK